MTTFYFIKISKLRLSTFFAAPASARFLAPCEDLLAAVANVEDCNLLWLQGNFCFPNENYFGRISHRKKW